MRLALVLLILSLSSRASAHTTYLRLNDEINEETVNPLIEGLAEAPHEKTDAVLIEINSPGGEVDEGFRLVKAIEHYPSMVVCVVDGEADSMASYVLVSCDVRVMTRRSIMMIHEPAIATERAGRINDWLNVVDWLAVTTSAMFEHYALHMHGITASELSAHCAGNRALWMDWHLAQKYGAVDLVIDRISDLRRAL